MPGQPAAAAQPEPEAPATGRQYVVLREHDLDLAPNSGWEQVGTFDASSGEDAIRKAAAQEAADAAIDTSGTLTYVAVPARSFQPVSLTAKVEPKIEFTR